MPVNFDELNLGSGSPISVPMTKVEVTVSTESLVGDYARAFVNEANRVNPLRAEQVQLTVDELLRYLKYLLTKRVETVQQRCSDWRRLKVLYIPSFYQYVLSMIGEVRDREYGLLLTPVMDEESTETFEDMVAISEKIGSFERDLQIVQDAMPRGIQGNINVMGSAIIAGYVRSYRKVDHPAATYVTAFADLKLRQQTAFEVLYRIQYDDVGFIQAALTSEKGIF